VLLPGGLEQSVAQAVHDGLLHFVTHVAHILIVQRLGQFFDRHLHCCFQAAEAENDAWVFLQGARKPEPTGCAFGRQAIDGRPTWIRQIEKLGRFVVGFTGGIIESASQLFVTTNFRHVNHFCVAAGNHQHHGRENHLFREGVGQNVTFNVVNAHQRQVRRHGQSLAGGKSHQQRAHQAGPGRHGQTVKILQFQILTLEKVIHQRQQVDQMSPGSQFRNHSAKIIVQLNLTGKQILRHTCFAVVKGYAGIIAGCFYAENLHSNSLLLTGHILCLRSA